MPEWVGWLVGGGGAGGVLWALNAIYRTWLSRKSPDVDAADRIAKVAADMTKSAAEQVAAIRADAHTQIASARADAANVMAAAMNDVSTARREASEARMAAQSAETFVRKLAYEAFLPSASVDRWRELVSASPPYSGLNGAGLPVR